VKRGWIVDTTLGVGRILSDVVMEASDAFGPLKATLGVISAIYRSYEVRLRLMTQNTLLTDPCIGDSRRQGKNPKAQLAHSETGDDIRSNSR